MASLVQCKSLPSNEDSSAAKRNFTSPLSYHVETIPNRNSPPAILLRKAWRDDHLTWSRNAEKIAAEAQLDGIYIVRTSLGDDAIGAQEAVEAYKSLSRVEHPFRNLKTARLDVRPVYVYSAGRVRAHVFLCTLACHVEWRLRRRLAPILFEDVDPEGARAQRTSPVQKAQPSDRARHKSATKTSAEGLPVHSLPTLLDDLATLALNSMELPGNPGHPFTVATQPTPLQSRAFELLGVDPAKMFPVRVQVEQRQLAETIGLYAYSPREVPTRAWAAAWPARKRAMAARYVAFMDRVSGQHGNLKRWR